ncbi:hypothetical protein [Roseibium salinum]|uniref:Uncharacterized protein n=1 Tax=Roseibium salinum TaxID=1604349 RepID=A0ABT3R3Z4_9HYPH|nr:hypothetical protein [Roseibium sp. DSM 29163]MCX2723996.1 hypothetical protein [Roseibium sp. DSM 29163]
MTKAAYLVFSLLFAATPAKSADFSDPDWPCIQRKVENLSIGLMWPHPVEETVLPQEARDLAEALSLRRVGLDEAEEHIRAFIATYPETGPQLVGGVFRRVFDNLAGDRQRVMRGIANYARSQAALSAKIDDKRAEMDTLLAAGSPDYDRIDKLEEQIDWDERIYKDRNSALTYVCETPVLLEKRIYAIARMLMEFTPE